MGAAKLREVAAMIYVPEPEDDSGVPDDRLRLMFTCCHPALALTGTDAERRYLGRRLAEVQNV